MAVTTAKGEIGEAMVMADLRRQGHRVAIPLGHDLPFDLIVIRKEDGRLEKVQCKYTTSAGSMVRAVIRSNSAWVGHRYTKQEVDWIAVFEASTSQCFYLPASVWDGQSQVNLRLTPPLNGQVKGIRYAKDFTALIGDPHAAAGGHRGHHLDLPFEDLPE